LHSETISLVFGNDWFRRAKIVKSSYSGAVPDSQIKATPAESYR
jgi:hypothetical protein